MAPRELLLFPVLFRQLSRDTRKWLWHKVRDVDGCGYRELLGIWIAIA